MGDTPNRSIPARGSTEAPQPLIHFSVVFPEIGQIFFVILAKRADGREYRRRSFPSPRQGEGDPSEALREMRENDGARTPLFRACVTTDAILSM